MKTMFVAATAVTALVLLAGGAPARAQGSAARSAGATAAAAPTDPAIQLSGADKSWLQDTANGAAYELALAKLGAAQGGTAQVKDYAEAIAKDHETLNSAMQEIARKHGVTLSPTMSQKQTSELSSLKAKSGGAFDHEFLAEMKRINMEDKGTLQKEVETTKAPDLKTFGQEMQAADARHEALAKKAGG